MISSTDFATGHPCARPLGFLAVLMFSVGCGSGDSQAGMVASVMPIRSVPLTVVEKPLFVTDDANQPILGQPHSVSESSNGIFAIADMSDKDIKLYDRNGERVGTVGREGEGPGEFTSLMSATFVGDSIFAYDFAEDRLSIFGATGQFARSSEVRNEGVATPWSIKSVDDRYLLSVGTPMDRVDRDFLGLFRTDGPCCPRSMMNLERYYDGGVPGLAQWTAVNADARADFVYASHDDSIFAFDYFGELVAAQRLPSELMPVSWRELLEENDGNPQHPDGSWIFDGHSLAMDVLAMDSSTVVVQLAQYNASGGVDRMDGGPIAILALNFEGEFGRFRLLGQHDAGGALLGRDALGRPVIVGYATGSTNSYTVSALEFVAAPDAPSSS
ncbi:MAG: 6-bladed beta-propeller [Bryobacterales bacterium]|nr:6-bladed beta-propeller [Bryobacterales bacterium]MDE2763627.1 6-bladed beta-propeller [Gemmatimonadota bacterium]MDE2870715.1 6-bladed beta-propeller [Gemmatimonadota bacterium]